MKRARQEHQKLERREAILVAGLALLGERPFQQISMSLVAERTGLVKGTLYLYFATKEELFLELFRDQLHAWFWDLEAGLEGLSRASRLEGLARLIADAAERRPAFLRLLAVLHSHLADNLPAATAQAFRRELHARAAAMGVLLERALPFLHPGQGSTLVFQILALMAGAQGFGEITALRTGLHALLLGLREANRG